MEKELSIQNDTYEFIGRLALALYGQNIRMSYATLMRPVSISSGRWMLP